MILLKTRVVKREQNHPNYFGSIQSDSRLYKLSLFFPKFFLTSGQLSLTTLSTKLIYGEQINISLAESIKLYYLKLDHVLTLIVLNLHIYQGCYNDNDS